MKRKAKKLDKFEIVAGSLAGIGSVFLAVGAFNNWFVIVSYILFLISACMYLWWARKNMVIGLLIMNIFYLFSDLAGIGTWLYNLLN